MNSINQIILKRTGCGCNVFNMLGILIWPSSPSPDHKGPLCHFYTSTSGLLIKASTTQHVKEYKMSLALEEIEKYEKIIHGYVIVIVDGPGGLDSCDTILDFSCVVSLNVNKTSHLLDFILDGQFDAAEAGSVVGARRAQVHVTVQYGLHFLCVPTKVQHTHHKVLTLHGELAVVVLHE